MTDHDEHDPIARLHAMASTKHPAFGIMERLEREYVRRPCDVLLEERLDKMFFDASKRIRLDEPPGFDNRGPGLALAIVAPTGVGKTRALQRYFQKHPLFRGFEKLTSPSAMIRVSGPSPCTSLGLAKETAAHLGYPIARRINAADLWKLNWERMKGMRKFVAHFDELQHASQYLSEKDEQDLANMLKVAMDEHRITLVLTGIETLGPFLDFDPQMAPRRVQIFDMPALVPADFPSIQRTIEGYCAKASIGFDLGAPLDMPDFHARLSHAALNAFGYCCRFILWAIEVALYANAEF